MYNSIWLQDRRWRWRVIVLVIVVAVTAALVWFLDQQVVAAVGITAVIFLLAAKAGDWIIDSADPADPKAVFAVSAPNSTAGTAQVADPTWQALQALTTPEQGPVQ
uniref:hypothetical protein n=1 Tax=Actinoplanes sp. CA-084688 TaxID=3239901 RepID=UPI003F49166A